MEGKNGSRFTTFYKSNNQETIGMGENNFHKLVFCPKLTRSFFPEFVRKLDNKNNKKSKKTWYRIYDSLIDNSLD